MELQPFTQFHGDDSIRPTIAQADGAGKRFLFVGNSLCLDLVNTEKMVEGRRTDLMQTVDDLKVWLHDAFLISASDSLWQTEAEGKKALTEIKSFRKVLRAMATDMAAGEPMRGETVTAINAALKRKSSVLQLRPVEGGWTVNREDAGRHTVDHVIAEIAESAAKLIAEHDWSHVRQCGSDRCILFFLDTTKNHKRRWCSMGVCGNRVKASAHYHRTRV